MQAGRMNLFLAAFASLLALTTLGACSQATPTAEEPAGEPGSEATQIWPRVEREGKITVGISADYPPFSYVDGEFHFDGLDIALMRAIGEQLGLEVSFKDLAFDGLGDALQVDQIDAAIAAITVTPEREALVDFTQPYYSGADALLVPKTSAVTVTRVEDLANLRVGVQRGSVYESALQKSLVDTGLMLPTQLNAYGQIEEAVSDLQEGRIDAVALDLEPARTFARERDLTVAAERLHPQQYAIAVAAGQTELLSHLNAALEELEAQGVTGRLTREYVGTAPIVAEPEPTATPEEATPEPTPACFDAMELVADLTFDDHGMSAPPTIAGGEPFVKTWRVRNSGTCTWNTSYTLTFARGNVPGADMGGSAIPIPGEVAPGSTVDLSVNLVAPPIPAVYQSFWQMHDSYGEAFGETLTVGIVVPIPSTPTPAPTQTPAPGLSFSADRTTIRSGECVQLSWKVDNASRVYLYPQGQGTAGHDVAPEGVRTECPATTTTYVLRAETASGAAQERQITVVVDYVPGLPVIGMFSVTPTFIGPGGCVELMWDVQGDVSNVLITRDGGALWSNAPFRSSLRDCPPGRGEAGYQIDAAGPGGTARAQTHVRIE